MQRTALVGKKRGDEAIEVTQMFKNDKKQRLNSKDNLGSILMSIHVNSMRLLLFAQRNAATLHWWAKKEVMRR